MDDKNFTKHIKEVNPLIEFDAAYKAQEMKADQQAATEYLKPFKDYISKQAADRLQKASRARSHTITRAQLTRERIVTNKKNKKVTTDRKGTK